MGDSEDLEHCREDILVSQNQDANGESADLGSPVEGGPSGEQILDDIPAKRHGNEGHKLVNKTT